MLDHIANALYNLIHEEWKSSEVLNGNIRLYRALDVDDHDRFRTIGSPLTNALAFGVLPEIRMASRRASSIQDRLKVRYHAFRASATVKFAFSPSLFSAAVFSLFAYHRYPHLLEPSALHDTP